MPIRQSLLELIERNVPSVREVVIDGLRLEDAERLDSQDIQALSQAAHANTHLIALTLNHHFITDVGLEHIATMRQIETLDLSYNELLSGDLTSLRHLQRLTTLNLSGITNITLESLEVICNLPRLSTLILDDTLLSDREAAILGQGRFGVLSAGCHQLAPEGLMSILTNPFLNSLDINALDEEEESGFYLNVDIADAIRNHPSLKSLNISGYRMSAVAFDLICENPQLERLNIRQCHISARTLDKALGLKTLQHLDVVDNPVDNAFILKALQHRRLQVLEFEHGRIHDELISELNKKLLVNAHLHMQGIDRRTLVDFMRYQRIRPYVERSLVPVMHHIDSMFASTEHRVKLSRALIAPIEADDRLIQFMRRLRHPCQALSNGAGTLFYHSTVYANTCYRTLMCLASLMSFTHGVYSIAEGDYFMGLIYLMGGRYFFSMRNGFTTTPPVSYHMSETEAHLDGLARRI